MEECSGPEFAGSDRISPPRGLSAWSGVSWSWPGEHRPTETSSVVAENRLGCPYPRAIQHKADGEMWVRTRALAPASGTRSFAGGRVGCKGTQRGSTASTATRIDSGGWHGRRGLSEVDLTPCTLLALAEERVCHGLGPCGTWRTRVPVGEWHWRKKAVRTRSIAWHRGALAPASGTRSFAGGRVGCKGTQRGSTASTATRIDSGGWHGRRGLSEVDLTPCTLLALAEERVCHGLGPCGTWRTRVPRRRVALAEEGRPNAVHRLAPWGTGPSQWHTVFRRWSSRMQGDATRIDSVHCNENRQRRVARAEGPVGSRSNPLHSARVGRRTCVPRARPVRDVADAGARRRVALAEEGRPNAVHRLAPWGTGPGQWHTVFRRWSSRMQGDATRIDSVYCNENRQRRVARAEGLVGSRSDPLHIARVGRRTCVPRARPVRDMADAGPGRAFRQGRSPLLPLAGTGTAGFS